MKLYIKYMVSLRCKMVVKAELKNLGLPYQSVELGTIKLPNQPTAEQRELLRVGCPICQAAAVAAFIYMATHTSCRQ